MSKRTGTTREGKVVPLNTTTRVPGGWTGYVLNAEGFAVEVFIPGTDAHDVIEDATKEAK